MRRPCRVHVAGVAPVVRLVAHHELLHGHLLDVLLGHHRVPPRHQGLTFVHFSALNILLNDKKTILLDDKTDISG